MRIVNKILATSVLVLLCVFFLTASVPSVPAGSWQSWNPLGDVRSGAAAVLLQDGKVLISGGSNTAGPTASADLFDTNGAFTATTPMNSARSGHTATLLGDGRVLVSGGDTGSGVTNSAEVFDPATGSWTLLSATLLDARAGHTASLLSDGRVLLAGGHNSGGALSSLEIFDPLNDDFTSAGTLTANRMNHAAAVLGDGRVLVIGGTADGTNALATVDIYDPVTRTVGVGPSLSTPRMSATATTTLDGKVAVIGGSNGSQDLASAEIFDPATGQITLSASNLATPRSGHNAFLLPHNNSILIVGGTSGGADLNSAELYFPWTDSFQTTGAMSTARPGMTGSALGLDGRFLAAGGTNLASTELYGFATVKTDAADYPPGSTVTITGSGWRPGETVTLTLVESPLFDTHGPYNVVADGNGNISDSSFVTDEHDLNIRFYLTAVGSQSGVQAQNTFTDANDNTSTTVSCVSTSILVGGSTSCIATVKDTNGSNGSPTGSVNWSIAPAAGSFIPATCTLVAGSSPNSSCSTSFTGTSAGTATITATYPSGGSGNTQWKTSFGTQSVTVSKRTTTTAVTVNSPAVVGQASTASVTVTDTDTGTQSNPSGTVALGSSDTGDTFGTCTLTNSGSNAATCSASVTPSKVGTSPHTITATFPGDTAHATSNGTASLAVSKANTTTTPSNASGTFGGPNVTLSANVTANSPSTGTVSEGTVTFTVKQGATTVGTVTSGTVAAGAGTASFSLSGVNAGTYTINATYNPAATTPNFNTSTAASPGTLTVSPANTTTTVGNSSGTTGGSANLTANVTAVSPSTATVNEGTVTFTVKQGATTIGTVTSGTVAAGAASASFPLSGVASGTYTIDATYNPAAIPNFNASTAATAGTLTVNNPVPTTTSVSPTSKNVGDALFTLTVNGTNFVSNSVVNFSGSPRTTSFVSATQLTASIPASDLTTAGTFNITVTNSAPGGGTSNAQTFTVNNLVPTTTSISPSTKTAGDAGFTLTVNGTNFVSTSTVNFNGSARTTTFVTATQVTAAITAADVANAGSFPITVTNPAPGGGTSNAQTLTVNPKLAFSTNAFATLIGLCSPQVSVQLQNGNGSAATLATPTTLNLSSNSGSGAFFSDTGCTTSTTTAIIAANASTGSFFYKDTVIGSPVITVAATGFTSIQQTEEFTSLRFNTASFSVQTNACSSPISLQSADAQTGSPTSLTQATTIALSSSSATGKFYSNAACTAQITTTLISPAIDGGHDTNNFFYKDPTAGAPALTASAGSALAQQTESVVAPPSISKAFGTSSIPVNGTTSLSFTITNPAANTVALTGVAFTDTLPAGLVVATPNGLTNTCGGTVTAAAGSGSVALGTGTVAINNSCSISVNVTGTTSGVKNNTTGAVTSTNGGTGNTASASITVASPPTISKAFSAASIPVNGSTSLSFTINNPNTIGLSGVAFSDTLPAGLEVATPNGLSSTCGGTTTAVAGSGSVSLAAGTLASSGSCSISVNVTGTTTGAKNNTTGVITSTESGPGAASNTASLTVNTRTTSTTIIPLTATASIGGSASFTITVKDIDAPPVSNPAGTIAVTDASSPDNTDTISPCSLTQGVNPVGTVSCQVTVTPTTPTGTHTLSASFTATDIVHANSSTTTSATLTVTNPATTTQVTSSHNPSSYGDSITFTATVSSDAGTPTGSVEFHEGACGGTLLAGPTGLNGSGQAVFLTATLNAGPHTISACYTPTGVFLASDGSVSQTVNKATPTVTISFAASSITYDGDPHPATATVTGVSGVLAVPTNGMVAISYKKSALPFPGTPTDAGSYTASAHFTSTNGNYNDADSTLDALLTISKADPVLSSVGGTFTYDGLPHGGSATATGVKGESLTPVNVAYKDSVNNLLTSAPVDAGSYLVSARFAGNDNYNQKQSVAEPLIINKADTTTVVTVAGGTSFTYDGDSHPATVSVTGAGGLNLTPAPVYSCGHPPINVADSGCIASYSYAGDNNYNPSSDSKTYTIKKAASVTTVTGGTFVFDGFSHSASVSVTGVGGLNLTPAPTYGGGCLAAPTNVAQTQPITCTASYIFAGDDNHDGSNGSAIITITKAPSTTTVLGGGSFVFDGLAHGATVHVSGAGGLTLDPDAVYTTCGTAPVHVAQTPCTASYSYAGDGDHDGSNGSAIITITKAPSTTTVSGGGSFVFDGNPHAATVAVTGAGSLSLTPAASYSGGCSVAPTHVSETTPIACTASYSYAGDGDHDGSGGSAIITIAKAPSVTTIGAGYTVIYNALPHGVTANVTGAGGLNQAVAVVYVPGGSTVPLNPGSYSASATYAGDADHLGSNTAGPVTITITYGACSAGVGPGGVILPPINSDGTSVYNRKGGSTIPVKFTVCDAFGNPISNPAAVFAGTAGSLTMLSEVRGTITVVNETTTNDIPDVAFRWTGSQWIFNMATSNLNQGSTYTFRINLAYAPQSIIFRLGVK